MAKKQAAKNTRDTKTTKSSGPPSTTAGKGESNRQATAPQRPDLQKSTTKPVEVESAKSSFLVVGIGASAGGLEALEELLANMPSNTGMAFVVVTHQHPGHTSLLPELLGKETEMPVVAAADGAKLEPNHVYVGPPGGHLAILNGTLHRMETEKKKTPRLPIDYFFRSLAEDQQERAVGIVLSGTGTDGTRGLMAIKGESGMAMVQEPQSAKYAGMPVSAQGTGLADYVLTPAAMPRQLVAYASGPYFMAAAVAAEPPTIPAEPMQKIFLLLRNRTGHDFSTYKANTIRRRIERRMNVHQLQSPSEYVRYLQENAHEIDLLFKELLIKVTSFFRDPEFWDALAAQPLAEMITSLPQNSTLRAWVPGCASGEEVFSLAIVMRECMEKTKRHADIQIVGTDLDSDAVDAARVGLYPNGIAVDVSPRRLERYFTHDDSTYRIRKEIRELAIFAPQNIIKDPPFTKLDILCCRNLLIYLNADLQKRLLSIFHYALKPGGLLMLGPSETIGHFTDLFDVVNKKWKIYRRTKVSSATHVVPEIPTLLFSKNTAGNATPIVAPEVRRAHISTLLERMALARYCPAFVVVNNRGDIVHVHGRTGAYLELAEGHLRTSVLDMAREGLAHELASVMRQAATGAKEVVRKNIRVKTNGDFTYVNLAAQRILDPEPIRGLLMLTFQPAAPPDDARLEMSKGHRGKATPNQVETLQRELQFVKESHQSTQEELETSNEELKSTNEELQSTNEEMQSTNEESESSQEEMESLNEELTTVNAELESRVDDLSQTNDDMQNLLNSTNIAALFLDDDLNIKRFTDQARLIVALRATDAGRPIGDVTSTLIYDDLIKDCQEVLDTLASKEREVQTSDGGLYLMRIMPYRTTEKVIDGLVVTFVNIKELREAEKSGELRSYFEAIFDTVRQPLVVLDEQCVVFSANRSFYHTFRLRPKQVLGIALRELGDCAWDIPELRELLEEILPQNTTVDNFEVEQEFPKIGRKVLLLNASRLDQRSAMSGMILLAMEDVTEKSLP